MTMPLLCFATGTETNYGTLTMINIFNRIHRSNNLNCLLSVSPPEASVVGCVLKVNRELFVTTF